MGLLCFVYLICALRTNIVFVLIFLFLVPSFGLLTGAFWSIAKGTVALATINKMLVAAGALTFVVDMLGWYLFFGILLASLDFPFQLPGKLISLHP
jgi:succinate-acetate transporter protein